MIASLTTVGKNRPTYPPPATDWLALDPLWEGEEEIVEQGLPHEELAPSWQILLLGDLSPTRHLRLLTGEPINVEVIDMSRIVADPDGIPETLQVIPAPRIRRQVWLSTASGQRLGYAASWWEVSNFDRHLQEKSLPIWDNLARFRTELFRHIVKIQFGQSAALERGFGEKGPFWGRFYYFYFQKRPLTLIFEVFSPYLSHYLGRCRRFQLLA